MSLSLIGFLIMLLIDFFVLFVLYRKNYNKYLSALCLYLLLIPFFSFQEISHRTFAAFFISVIPVVLYLFLKRNKNNIRPEKGIVCLLTLSVLVFVCGTFDFSLLDKGKISQTKSEMYQIKKNFVDWLLQQDKKGEDLPIVRSNISSYVKSNNCEDAWGNSYKFVYDLKVNNDFIILDFQIVSAGPDCCWNTSDDITTSLENYSWGAKVR